MDFSSYSTRSKFAKEINAGYPARLNGLRLSDNPHLVWNEQPPGSQFKQVGHLNEKAEAWQYGWRRADQGDRGAR